MTPSRTLSVLAAVALLFAAGCGDDDDTTTPAGQTTTTVADSPADDGNSGDNDSTGDQDRAADQQIADDAVLTLADMPTGWSSLPRDDDDSDEPDEFDEQIAECLDVPVEEVTDSGNPKATSDTFVDADDTEVEAEVVVAPTVDEATEDWERATSQQFLDCIREVLPEAMEASAEEEGGEVEIVDSSIGPLRIDDLGDRSTAFRLTVTVAAEGFEVDVYADLLFAQVGRATAQVSTMSFFSPADITFSQELLQTMVERLSDVDDLY